MFKLAPLAYPKDALQPIISAETLEYHHDKHHQAYVDHLNKLISGTPLEACSLEEIVKTSSGAIFNNAGQIWNHNFYWASLTPEKLKGPKGDLAQALDKSFGSLAAFEKQFEQAANEIFGSGWAWLVNHDGQLKIQTTANAENPLRQGAVPLFTCDVWEHAYYIDYRNERNKYLAEFWKILNWDFIAENYQASLHS